MMAKEYLLASDFDQTLSFNDSGIILSEIVGIPGFREKVAGLSRTNLIQQGGELAYLLRHDPDYRAVRREHLIEAGKRVRLKQNIPLLVRLLLEGLEGHRFAFYVISAAPEEVIQSALEGIVPPDHIYGTRFEYDPASGEIRSIVRVAAGYGKVAVLDELQAALQVGSDRIVYVGDGSSDIHVMLHVNRRDGFTIAASPRGLGAPHEMHFDHRGLVDAQHPVVVEVVLLDAAVLEGDLAPQDARDPEDDPALDLCLDGVRVDDDAAIHGADHPRDADLPLLRDRHLRNLRDVAPEGV